MVEVTKISTKAADYARKGLNQAYNARVMQLLPKPIKAINSVKNFTGEFGTSCINAIGTGFIAPIFIAYNPLSKTDEQTKKYSALRQPISAALSIAMQLAFVLPFNAVVQYLANNNLLPKHLNKTIVKDDKYLINDIKKQSGMLSMDKTVLQQRLMQQREKAYATAIDQLLQDGTLLDMPEEQFKELLEETRKELLESETKKYNCLYNNKTEQYAKRLEYFKDNTEEARSVFNELSEFFNNPKHDEKECNKYLKGILKQHKKSNKEIKTILYDLKKCQSKSDKIKLLNRDINHLDKVKTLHEASFENICEYLRNSDEKHAGRIKKVGDNVKFLNELENTIKQKTPKEVIKQVCDSTREEMNFLFHTVAKEISNANSRYKSYKDGTGLLIGFVTLPISCTLLNWLYPIFMEKFFPSLCKDKEEKQEDTFKKQEVKN